MKHNTWNGLTFSQITFGTWELGGTFLRDWYLEPKEAIRLDQMRQIEEYRRKRADSRGVPFPKEQPR